MSFKISVGGMDQMKALERRLGKMSSNLRKVPTRVVNRVANGARTDAVKILGGHLTIKKKEIRSRIEIKKASFKHPIAYIWIRGTAVPLSEYAMRKQLVTTRRGKRRGVTVQVRRNSSRRKVRRGFQKTSRGDGKTRIYARYDKRQYPIYQLHGPALPAYLQRNPLKRRMKSVSKRLEVELTRQLNYALNHEGR